jgi:hypothetical protein
MPLASSSFCFFMGLDMQDTVHSTNNVFTNWKCTLKMCEFVVLLSIWFAFLFWFFSTNIQTQGLVLARQALYHLSHIPSHTPNILMGKFFSRTTCKLLTDIYIDRWQKDVFKRKLFSTKLVKSQQEMKQNHFCHF